MAVRNGPVRIQVLAKGRDDNGPFVQFKFTSFPLLWRGRGVIYKDDKFIFASVAYPWVRIAHGGIRLYGPGEAFKHDEKKIVIHITEESLRKLIARINMLFFNPPAVVRR